MICTGNLILEIMLLEYLNINSLQNQKKLSTPRSLHFDTNNYLHEGKLILIILSILEWPYFLKHLLIKLILSTSRLFFISVFTVASFTN